MKNTPAIPFNVVLMMVQGLWDFFNSRQHNLFLFKWSYIYTTDDEENYTDSNRFDVPGRVWDFVHVVGTHKIK